MRFSTRRPSAVAFSGTQSEAPPSISDKVKIQMKNLNVSILFAPFLVYGSGLKDLKPIL
jgi:hypothetical protein